MNGWKVTAIIFIILFVLETLAFGFLIKVGMDVVNREIECSNDVCLSYDSFYYDDTTNVCSCYLNNEVAKQEYIKWSTIKEVQNEKANRIRRKFPQSK